MSDALTERAWLELHPQYRTGTAVPSPCLSVCRIEAATGWCEGCFRTLDEIADWSVLEPDEKRAVWDALPQRFDVRRTKS